VLARAAGLLAFWVVLIGAAPADLAAGALSAGFGAWVSARLLPPGTRRVRVGAWAAIAARLAAQALVAGADVARRALDPRLPLRPGTVSLPLRLPPGPGRDAFCALTSLLPGTVPTGLDERGRLLVHCLDRDAPVAAQLAADEARFARALGERGDA
jgi:multicomponent Na+:H+ antiporter subunit E